MIINHFFFPFPTLNNLKLYKKLLITYLRLITYKQANNPASLKFIGGDLFSIRRKRTGPRGSKFPEQLSNERELDTRIKHTGKCACVDGKMIREKFVALPLPTVFPALVRLLKYNRVARRSWIFF